MLVLRNRSTLFQGFGERKVNLDCAYSSSRALVRKDEQWEEPLVKIYSRNLNHLL